MLNNFNNYECLVIRIIVIIKSILVPVLDKASGIFSIYSFIIE